MVGTELLVSAAAAGLSSLITDTISESGRGLLGRFGANLSQSAQQAIFDASKQYIENYAERHGILKVLGMREPVKLEDIYTEVQFLDEQDSNYDFVSPETLERDFRQASERGFRRHRANKQSGIKIINQKQFLMVLGAPGSGKSTFLRKVGLESLKGRKGSLKNQKIAVFLELKTFFKQDFNIQKKISNEFVNCGLPNAERFTQTALDKGNLLILLDGLDEVPTENLDNVLQKIQDFVDLFHDNHYVISCRKAAYRYNLRRFTDVVIADFSNFQIQQFIINWFQSEEDKRFETGQKCWQLLQKPENSAAKELAYTPLLLTFLCLAYDRSQSFPNNRSILYQKALRILLEEWASEKRILREEIYKGLNVELEEVLLSEIAYNSFAEDRLFMYQSEIVDQIKEFLADNLNAPQHLSGEAVLNAVEMQQGILVERAEDIYSFSHLTLQEYLAAQYIEENRLIGELVENHLTDRRWHEIFLLVAGLMRTRRGADELLVKINQEKTRYTSSSKIQSILEWAASVTQNSNAEINPIVRRATALFFILSLAKCKSSYLALALIDSDAFYRDELSEQGKYGKILTGDLIKDVARQHGLSQEITVGVNLIIVLNNIRNLGQNTAFELADKISRFETNCVSLNNNQQKLFADIDFSDLAEQLRDIRSSILSANGSNEAYQESGAQLWRVCLRAFHIDPNVLKLPKEDKESVANYLYSNYLMLRCKRAAVRVPQRSWKTIENNILLPSNTG